MTAMRSSYLTGFMICLPLLIWTWGSIACAETAVNAALIINQALNTLWCLQMTAIFMSVPWSIRDHTPLECYLANLCLILIPLPFVAMAWLASALSFLFVIKIIVGQLVVSMVSVALVLMLKEWRLFTIMPVKLDMPLCLIASSIIWNTSEQWLNWLIQ